MPDIYRKIFSPLSTGITYKQFIQKLLLLLTNEVKARENGDWNINPVLESQNAHLPPVSQWCNLCTE